MTTGRINQITTTNAVELLLEKSSNNSTTAGVVVRRTATKSVCKSNCAISFVRCHTTLPHLGFPSIPAGKRAYHLALIGVCHARHIRASQWCLRLQTVSVCTTTTQSVFTHNYPPLLSLSVLLKEVIIIMFMITSFPWYTFLKGTPSTTSNHPVAIYIAIIPVSQWVYYANAVGISRLLQCDLSLPLFRRKVLIASSNTSQAYSLLLKVEMCRSFLWTAVFESQLVAGFTVHHHSTV